MTDIGTHREDHSGILIDFPFASQPGRRCQAVAVKVRIREVGQMSMIGINEVWHIRQAGVE